MTVPLVAHCQLGVGKLYAGPTAARKRGSISGRRRRGWATKSESQPIISLRPSTTRSTSSSEARARRRPIRSTDRVRT
jgi:hypothetical protein